MRVLVVWCPDWPVVAGLAEVGGSATAAAAVLGGGEVVACNGPARTEGVRRGQRRRDAQSRCPGLRLLDVNPDRDARAFDPVLAAVEQLRPGVAPVRPGLLAVRAPGRYFGGESHAAAVVSETLVEAGVWDCRLGIADDLFTAEQAARTARVQACEVVPTERSAAFLRQLPVEVLEGDGPEGIAAVSLLRRLGFTRLGDVADLPAGVAQQRFGAYGADVWRRVRGQDATMLGARTPPPDLEVEIAFEPPLESVEAVTFSVRTTAERFVTGLASRQLVATAVRVEAEADGVVASTRSWLHPRFFSAADLVDRVHWQLQSPLTSALRSRRDAGSVGAPVERVRFVPETVEGSAAHTEGLWGGGTDERVARGVARVQAMIGFDGVRSPVLQGGRTPQERQASVPWGERAVGLRPRERPWPGQLPGPPPVRVFVEPPPAEVVDEGGRAVAVTVRGQVTGEPCRFRLMGIDGGSSASWQPVAAWAGPWPIDESWWAEETDASSARACRFQVVGADARAWLLVCDRVGWRVEASYD